MHPYISRNIKNVITIPQIVQYFNFELNAEYTDIPESHNFWEFMYVESGDVIVKCEERLVELKANDILFHKPNEMHVIHIINNSAAKLHFVSFCSSSKAMSLFNDLKLNLPYDLEKELFIIFDEAVATFEPITEKEANFLQPLDNAPLGGQQLYKMYLEGFLIKLARYIEQERGTIAYNSKKDFEKIVFQKIMNKLSENVYANYSVMQLCKELSYSRTYLSTLFKKYSGSSIMYHYNRLKIQEAKRLIKERSHSLSEIASMLGFNNQYYFSRTFKKYEGVAPSEYKTKF